MTAGHGDGRADADRARAHWRTVQSSVRRSSSFRRQSSDRTMSSGAKASGRGGGAASRASGRDANWMHPMLAVCSVMSGNVVLGGAESIPGRALQAFLHLFAWVYPVIMLVGVLLVSDASGEPVKWDVYLWLVTFVMTATLPYLVVQCYSPHSVDILQGLRRETHAQEELLIRKVAGEGAALLPAEEWDRSFWVYRALSYALVFFPQAVFLLYLIVFFLTPAMQAPSGGDATGRDTFLDSEYLLGDGSQRAIMGSLHGPALLAVLGTLHCLRIMLVWFTLMETLFLAATWINACCGSVRAFDRAVRQDAGLSMVKGIEDIEWIRASARCSPEELPLTSFLSQPLPGSPGATSEWDQVKGGPPPAQAGAPPIAPPLRGTVHAFSTLRVGVHTLNALLAAPMTLTFFTFLGYFFIAAAISHDGRAGDAQWIITFTTFTIFVACLLLLFFMGRVADAWLRTSNDVGGLDITFALVATAGESETANLQASVRRTAVGFKIMNLVISTQTIIWFFVYVTILIVSSGVLSRDGRSQLPLFF